MAQAMKKAKTMPDLPPMALPMATMRRVRRVRSRVVLNRFIMVRYLRLRGRLLVPW